MTSVSADQTTALQAQPPRSKSVRDDAAPRDDFSAMIDSSNTRPAEPTRTATKDQPDRTPRAANDRRNDASQNDADAKTAPSSADDTQVTTGTPKSTTSKVETGTTKTKTTDAATSDTTKADTGKTADAVTPTAVTATATTIAIAVPPIAPLIVPQPVAPVVQTPTPSSPVAANPSGPLLIAAAALATSAATVDASAAQPTTPAMTQQLTSAEPVPSATAAGIATPASTAAAEATAALSTPQPTTTDTKPEAVVADPALAVAAGATILPKATAKSKTTTDGVDVAADATTTEKTADGKATDAKPAATALALHAMAKGDSDTTPVKLDTTVEPAATAASHERHVSAPQTGAADLSATTLTSVQQTALPATSTPAAATQLTVVASPTAPVPLNALAMQIAATATSGKTSFDIRLDPAELGRIDVRLDVDRHGNVTSHLTVEKPETLAMLKQDAPQLQRALNDAGLQTSDKGLQFSLSDQSLSGQNNQNGAQDSGGRPSQRLIVAEDDLPPVAMAGRSYGRLLSSSSGVDIRV